jgi:hypothetical protein
MTVRLFERVGSDYTLTQCHNAEKRNPRQRTTFGINVVEIISGTHFICRDFILFNEI